MTLCDMLDVRRLVDELLSLIKLHVLLPEAFMLHFVACWNCWSYAGEQEW